MHASAFHLRLVLRGMFKVETLRRFEGRKSIGITHMCSWMAVLLAYLGRGWSDFRRRELLGCAFSPWGMSVGSLKHIPGNDHFCHGLLSER